MREYKADKRVYRIPVYLLYVSLKKSVYRRGPIIPIFHPNHTKFQVNVKMSEKRGLCD